MEVPVWYVTSQPENEADDGEQSERESSFAEPVVIERRFEPILEGRDLFCGDD